MFDAVTSDIPGAKLPAQGGDDNVGASELAPLGEERMAGVRKYIRQAVHDRW